MAVVELKYPPPKKALTNPSSSSQMQKHDQRKKRTMSSDEFSFPNLAHDGPNFASSPPLWRVPLETSLESCHEEEEDDDGRNKGCQVKRLWYSSLGSKLKRTCTSDDEEEKMDMLWENFFNEELHRISSFGKRRQAVLEESSSSNIGDLEDYDSDERGGNGAMAEFCCVQALKMPRNSPAMITNRRPNLLVILKVFKKLFLLQNSHCPKKSK